MKVRYILLGVVLLIAISVFSLQFQQDFLKRRKGSRVSLDEKAHSTQQRHLQLQQQQQQYSSNSASPLRLRRAPSHAISASTYLRKVIRINRLQHGAEKSDAYDPHFIYTLFPPEGYYPVWIVGDVFIVCETKTLSIISRVYYHRLDLDHKALVVYVSDPKHSSGRRRLIAKRWRIASTYETAVVGEFLYDGGLACEQRDQGSTIKIDIEYHYLKNGSLSAVYVPFEDEKTETTTSSGSSSLSSSSSSSSSSTTTASTSSLSTISTTVTNPSTIDKLSASFDISASPSMPYSRWAMVAVFSFSRFLLKVWIEYWRLLGIQTFYLYYNGKSEEVPLLLEELKSISVNIVIIEWPMLHWITTHLADNTHGQPMAINNAFQRFGHLHDFIAFYDLDEFLVLPNHDNLDHFVERYTKLNGPFSFLRSQCSWSMLILDDFEPVLPISNVTLGDFFERRLLRGGPAMSREKYFLNTSAFKALGMNTLNLHGVYTHQDSSQPLHGKVLEEKSLTVPGYHVHLLNEDERYKRTKDYRIAYLGEEGKRVNSTELGDMVKRALRRKRAGKKQGKEHKLISS